MTELPLIAARPGWLRAGTIKFAVLCGAIALVAMLSPRMSPDEAGAVAAFGAAGIVGGGVALALVTRGLAARAHTAHPELTSSQSVVGALLAVLRGTGLPLLGLAFFLAWSFVFCALWWFDPARSFTGLDAQPRYSDFFYYAVSTALISPPGDIIATSRGARAATLIEMLAGLALVTTYVSSFAGSSREPAATGARTAAADEVGCGARTGE